MGFPIDKKLVIAIASSALFDLSESDNIFSSKGEEAYRRYQQDNIAVPLGKGVAFPFISRLLRLNTLYSEKPIEVIFLSKNGVDAGQRIYKSAQYYGLDITRGAFLTGKSPHPYIPAFGASLFLSASEDDVKAAIAEGYPAGIVLPSRINDDTSDMELRIAFDFDGVIADDESEAVYKQSESLEDFQAHEIANATLPHNQGPLMELIQKISKFQRLEAMKAERDNNYCPALRVSIVTARNAPANERVVTTINKWGLSVDEVFFLGGIDKKRILNILKPHIFFDDQMRHLEDSSNIVPSVHIPFGVRN